MTALINVLAAVVFFLITSEALKTSQIKVDDELQHGLRYKKDTVTVMGFSYDVSNDTTCCEECKMLYKDTELVGLVSETASDHDSKRCECIKSKPGIVPSTMMVGIMSGKCGLWDYNGEGELGEGRMILGMSTLVIIDNVSDASYCCEACMDKFPDTQLFDFNKEFKECFCQKTENDLVPTTMEVAFAIGTCLHRQLLENLGGSGEDIEPLTHIQPMQNKAGCSHGNEDDYQWSGNDGTMGVSAQDSDLLHLTQAAVNVVELPREAIKRGDHFQYRSEGIKKMKEDLMKHLDSAEPLSVTDKRSLLEMVVVINEALLKNL